MECSQLLNSHLIQTESSQCIRVIMIFQQVLQQHFVHNYVLFCLCSSKFTKIKGSMYGMLIRQHFLLVNFYLILVNFWITYHLKTTMQAKKVSNGSCEQSLCWSSFAVFALLRPFFVFNIKSRNLKIIRKYSKKNKRTTKLSFVKIPKNFGKSKNKNQLQFQNY